MNSFDTSQATRIRPRQEQCGVRESNWCNVSLTTIVIITLTDYGQHRRATFE